MRNRKTLAIIFLGLLFGISGAAYMKDKQRGPSSVGTAKKIPWLAPPLGKHLALVTLDITPPKNIPESGTDSVALEGRIFVNQSVEGGLSYVWSLPEDVKVIEGAISGTFTSVPQGQVIPVKIIVSGFNKEKQRLISLEATGHKGSMGLGGSAIVTSRPEDTWEAVAPEMRRAAQEQLAPDKATRR